MDRAELTRCRKVSSFWARETDWGDCFEPDGFRELDFDEFVDGNLLGLRLLFDERLVELFETEPLLLFDRLAAGLDWVLRFAPLSPDLSLT
ncbi:MAG: hypothetical protein VX084_10590 [Planctomycetota bacterium]|nr:hypothetical protein [Planctomycetota bacterium]